MYYFNELKRKVEERQPRSAWGKGVKAYAMDLLDELEERIERKYYDDENILAPKLLIKTLLNGADDWNQYSWGGCSLIYNSDIAERLCTPSELKRKKNGELNPNSREDWLDVQARALYQAAAIITRTARTIEALEEGEE